ncbi:MAG: GNAT family N-acetyltransferase [Acidobacteriaceae bacterium]|nr:GNAT family N-acetyltransferase [Acidobacteriaceae bacterium]
MLISPELREYRVDDWKAMWALDVLCFEPVFRFSRRAMREFAEAADALTVLAEAEGELAGFCIVHLSERMGYVVTLDVAEAWRRRGLAQRLMAEVERQASNAGAVGMELHAFTGNAGAIRFYERIGYERVGTAENFYGPGLDALIYRKPLPSLGSEPISCSGVND